MSTWDERMRSRQQTQPRIELLEDCWVLATPTGKRIHCGIYRVAGPGVELRCGFSEDDVLRTQRVSDVDSARQVAEQWRLAVVAKGFKDAPT